MEKILKAVLIYHNTEFPRTHSISLLIDIIVSIKIFVPDFVKERVILNEYAVNTRYPGDYEKVKKKDFIQAIKIAKSIFDWAITLVNMKDLFEK